MSDLKKANELEQLQHSQLMHEANREEASKIAAINAQNACHGILQSGATIQAITTARAEKMWHPH